MSRGRFRRHEVRVVQVRYITRCYLPLARREITPSLIIPGSRGSEGESQPPSFPQLTSISRRVTDTRRLRNYP